MARSKKNSAISETTAETKVAKRTKKKSSSKEPSIEASIAELVASGDVLSFCRRCNFFIELPKNFMSVDIICEHCGDKLAFEDVIFRSRANFIKC